MLKSENTRNECFQHWPCILPPVGATSPRQQVSCHKCIFFRFSLTETTKGYRDFNFSFGPCISYHVFLEDEPLICETPVNWLDCLWMYTLLFFMHFWTIHLIIIHLKESCSDCGINFDVRLDVRVVMRKCMGSKIWMRKNWFPHTHIITQIPMRLWHYTLVPRTVFG